VAVEGSLQVRSYTAQDGSKRWVTEIIADHVEAQDKAKDKPQQGQFTEVEDDELPFD
jgi:single-strand DNA-binding protein